MRTRTVVAVAASLLAAILAAAWGDGPVQEKPPGRRAWTITAGRCVFSPARIEVDRGDIVRITLVAEDGPHSFVIDGYRIAKRAVPGRSEVFEFLADKPGTFAFYSDLTSDRGCPDMRGELVVH
jgi:heme/copper-type cytochrome/quinol oxidase subunit 2